MAFEQMVERMDEAVALGVKEFGFTGGEPFMHPRIIETLAYALDRAPSLILTNGTLFRPKMCDRLRDLVAKAKHPLTIRVSLDGETPEQNDAVRGEGAFERAMEGVRALLEIGIRPTIATTCTWENEPECAIRSRMQALMAEHGVENCPTVIFPALLMGAEAERTRGYREGERVTAKCVEGADPSTLMCSNSRLVTERGVWVCTLLANEEDARMGETLRDTLSPFKITHGACYTCFTQGVACSAKG
jgi:hypothetical protein